ncbi:aldehyde dehydrogenase-like protein [Ustulina deusta]|nr:aldehyde dehydrogenase-like protein [Ustulina deusta]
MTQSQMAPQVDFTTFNNVIGGELCNSSSGATRFAVNPATLEQNPQVPISTLEDVNRAIHLAQNATKAWANTSWSERQHALKGYTDAFEAYIELFARMLVKEQGKSLFEARFELQMGLGLLRGFCEMSLPDEVIEDSVERRVITRYTPVGIVVGIVPWNYPIMLACGKIGSALVAGNAFILKPSPFAPYCNLKMAELGTHFFPPGIFQALSGEDNLGPWLTEHPQVNLVSFSGSGAVGKKVMRSCSSTLKRVILELGGNDPAIVCADVDPSVVAPKLGFFAFANSGQICAQPKRLYVHESVYADFRAAMIAYIEKISLEQGEQPGSIGPVSNAPQYERVKDLLADIKANQLTIATGDTEPLDTRSGFFLSPTLVDNPPDNSRIVVEEPFGPVLPLLKWSDETDVINRANSTEYGLGASVWSKDAGQAERIARQLEAGTVWINTHMEIGPKFPFGGHKQSGIGCEWGVEGLKGYCNLQTIHTRLA